MNDHENIEEDDGSTIAIVGMACHLPGAENINEYWHNLREGVESVENFTDEQLLAAGEDPAVLADPNYVRAQPLLKGFDRFDAKFWGFSPQDAAVTDPAHRIFLEVAYQSLEHAGHTGYDSEGTVGVFASSGASQYWMDNLNTNPQLIEEMGEFLVRHTGNDMNFLATRLSYELDLRGPSLNIQTACSSSLVAVHMAVQSLLGGECDTAIVGGSTVLLPQGRGYLYRDGEIMSPDGHCRPFDAKSAGTVFGSGAGAIVLRRLDDAKEDGDSIYALIRGSAINNDGAQKVGYLAPGVEGQAGAVAEALEVSGVDAEDVSYIEAHGTGTLIGDPIEFEALNQVYREATDKRSYCRLGSVKSNIGHLGEAAGAAAIIKVILSLQHKQLPPSINYTSPNPDMEIDDSPFIINDKLVDWQKENGKRLAGITALGAGGTNAHIILDQAPEPEAKTSSRLNKQLLVISAKTETALNTACRNLAAVIRAQNDLELADVAYTLQLGRRAYSHRRVLAVGNREDAIFLLEGGDARRVAEDKAEDRQPSLVFMFPGGGAQYAGMGAELYEKEQVYRQAFDDCLACLERVSAEEIKSLVFAKEALEIASKTLECPSITLPSLFATEYALAKQMLFWGVEPVAFVGHSMGEYTAACLSGVISLNDAMSLVRLRGELFEKIDSGAMLSISLPEKKARAIMPENLDIAAVNADDLCVASGPVEGIEKLQKSLEDQDIDCTRVRINVAAHSAMLDSVLDEFRDFCQSINFSAPEVPFTSNLTGTWITEDEATSPDYWVEHLRNTVRFSENIATVLSDDNRVLVEVGPGRALTNLSQAGSLRAQATFNTMRHASETYSDVECALRAFGRIWTSGIELDWRRLWENERRQRIALPGYPFERKAYWVDPGTSIPMAAQTITGDLKKRADISEWFAQYNWAQSAAPKLIEELDQTWLIFEDEIGLAQIIIEQMEKTSKIIRVKPGNKFESLHDGSYRLATNNLEQFESLMQSLDAGKRMPQHIIYLWPVTEASRYPDSSMARLDDYETCANSYFWGLFNLSKVLSEMEDSIRLTVVSSDMHAIGNKSCPEKSLLIGPVSVLPHESPHVKTQSIDVSPAIFKNNDLGRIARQIVNEVSSAGDDLMVAYRGSDRLIRRIESEPLEKNTRKKTWLRDGGVYFISGGLGGVGLTIAHYLAENGAGYIILQGRQGLPDRSVWKNWLETHVASDSTANKILAVEKIEKLGAKVVVLAADVTDYERSRSAIESAIKDCGPVDGVIHAAGSMDDQLILLKTPQSAQRLIDAKVKGALILDSIFSQHSLDFFIVFSSVASYLGLPGQIDYSAANAFLDAFSKERATRENGESLAINWNAWRDVGMAAQQQLSLNDGVDINAERHAITHPALDYYTDLEKNRKLFSTRLTVDGQWMLSEHRVKNGGALIPGTGFIELFRAVFLQYCLGSGISHLKNSAIELSSIQFFTALQVSDDVNKSMHIEIKDKGQQAYLTVYSDDEGFPHAVANAKRITNSKANIIDLSAIRKRCTKTALTQGKFLDQTFMNFGPRWACISGIQWGGKEALLDIVLPEEYAGDLEHYGLHPALLDMATGGVQFLIDGFSKEDDFYVPVAYQKVLIHDVMPRSFLSYVRVSDQSVDDFAVFDVTLLDETGKAIVEINGFTMKKVAVDFAANEGARTGIVEANIDNQQGSLASILSQAILPEEGVEAFDRIMSQSGRTQWIVSSVDTSLWRSQLESPADIRKENTKASYIREDIHDPDSDIDIVEIEQCLLGHQAVEQVFVRSFLDESGGRRLMAYYYPDDYQHVTVSDLRKYSKSLLSNEKVPQQFIEIDEVPRDEQGEVDREKLQDPLRPEDKFVEPSTKTEKQLAEIWQDVLGVDRVGLNENFFDIGGHSLLSIRIIVKVDKKFGVRLSQPTMVMHTLEQIASEIDTECNDADTVNHTEQNQHALEQDVKVNSSNGIMKKLFGRK